MKVFWLLWRLKNWNYVYHLIKIQTFNQIFQVEVYTLQENLETYF